MSADNVTIRDIRTIMTEPDNIRLVIVKIETSEPGLYGVRIGHIGAGTFHPVFFAPDSWDFDRMRSLAKKIRARMVALQAEFGCTTGEQGIFPQHYEWFQRYYGPEYTAAAARVRDALDPNGVLNPARFQRPAYNG